MTDSQPETESLWSPLQNQFFLGLWIAQAVSNIGTWMQSTGAAWLMTSLDPSPLMVALVQTASSIPIFFLGVAAGALADIVNRRVLLIFTQFWMLVSATVLAVLTFLNLTTSSSLLLLTFSLGVGSAFMSPAFQAIFPELVKRKEIPAAVTLNGVSFNIARSVGPALGGIVVALAGPGAVFLLNAVSFVGVIFVLYRWRQPERWNPLPSERLLPAIRMGIRYARYATDLQAALIRTGVFIVFASAFWALLPLVARFNLDLGAAGYGILLGAVGVGSLIGAAIQPHLRQRAHINELVTFSELIFAATTIALGYLLSLPLLIFAMLIGGIAWLILMASFNTMVQTVVPSWVQARALGLYVTVFMGGMAFSSILWGIAADNIGVQTTLLISGVGLVASLPFMLKVPVREGVHLDLSPSVPWPDPRVVIEPHKESGPVLITIDYRVNSAHTREFLAAMRELERLRRRDGAIDWALYRDVADPDSFLEVFIAESWVDHLRQHTRITVADMDIQEKTRIYHTGEQPPLVHHYISAFDETATDENEEKEK
ncbi:MAG: MFS transporter [Methanoregulaceae archaeon]|nr:MFS transporter [Methanoregulaceae archaeon]